MSDDKRPRGNAIINVGFVAPVALAGQSMESWQLDRQVAAGKGAISNRSANERRLMDASVMCAWCGEHPSAGKHQASECCETCKSMGAAYRVRMSLQRWKRLCQTKVVRDER